MHQVNIGGERLGSGKKMNVELKTFNRSTHDLSYVFRSSMSAGTIVPFLTEVALPGDTFDIDLDMDVKTLPTVGPLFGSYKAEAYIFEGPIRLYQAQLHQNALNIGMKMNTIKLPQMFLKANPIDFTKDENGNYINPPDNQQNNPSSIFSYLRIRGLGWNTDADLPVTRYFDATRYLMYWDVYKNYLANKQEEIGAVLHTPVSLFDQNIAETTIGGLTFPATVIPHGRGTTAYDPTGIDGFHIIFQATGTPMPANNQLIVYTNRGTILIEEAFGILTRDNAQFQIEGHTWQNGIGTLLYGWGYITDEVPLETIPKVTTFPLKNIDDMRNAILAAVNSTEAFDVNAANIEPYSLALQYNTITVGTAERVQTSKMYSQEGLALKTYQSDLFNNWLQTNWIIGPDSITELTAVSTATGSFTIDQLILTKKVYDMLNQIAISGGSYRDWIGAVYSERGPEIIQGPSFHGGLIKELYFQEVVSNAGATTEGETQPLGTLAGKGVMSNQTRGGRIHINIDEPGHLLGIVMLTPRVDYSQGNKWDVNLKTLDDLHKPALDEIGFQDLPVDQMAYWETHNTFDGKTQTYKSAGKQPAWIQYMTNVNVVLGNFADPNNQMFMTLNRRYELTESGGTPNQPKVKDLTTYIDPVKFNYIFAQTSRDAQNFWVQIGVKMTVRRRMSAKVIPNL